MKRLICLLVAFVAVAAFGIQQVNADYPANGNGYGHHCYGNSFYTPGFERPPYFALFPPVHYSQHIVRRPYGVSPFAAPPGVMPVEMTVEVEPLTIKNPYFRPETRPTSSASENKDPET